MKDEELWSFNVQKLPFTSSHGQDMLDVRLPQSVSMRFDSLDSRQKIVNGVYRSVQEKRMEELSRVVLGDCTE